MMEFAERAERIHRPVRFTVCAVLCAAVLALAPATVWAEGEAGDMAKEAGIGTGSALASLIYAPVKLCYATLGVVVGGLAFAFSGGDKEVAQVVLTPSVRGDYVITTDHLTGQDNIEFLGREPAYRPDATNVAVAPESDDWSADGW